MSYPFLFFGRRPDDWHTSVEHPYRLRFATSPDAEARRQVAAAFARALVDNGAADAKGIAPWHWAGDWAFLTFTEPPSSGEPPDTFFNLVDAAFRAVHRAAPLREAVFEGAIDEGGHAWDVWTRKRRKAPPSPPEGERGVADPAFDDALTAALESAAAEKAAREREQASALVAMSAVWQKVSAEAWPTDPPPADPEPDGAVKALLAQGKKIERYLTRAGVTVGLYKWGVRYVGKNGKVKAKATHSHGNHAWLAPEGSYVLVDDGLVALRLELPGGEARALRSALHWRNMTFHEVAGGQWLADGLRSIHLGVQTATSIDDLATVNVDSSPDLYPACGGRLVVVSESVGETVQIVAVAKAKLHALPKSRLRVVDARSVAAPDGTQRLLVRDPNRVVYELANLPEILRLAAE
jgi:hypothetical protein